MIFIIHKNTSFENNKFKGGFLMRNFKECLIILTIFFVAVLAVLEIDSRCGRIYGEGGDISAAAVSTVTAIQSFSPG